MCPKILKLTFVVYMDFRQKGTGRVLSRVFDFVSTEAKGLWRDVHRLDLGGGGAGGGAPPSVHRLSLGHESHLTVNKSDF